MIISVFKLLPGINHHSEVLTILRSVVTATLVKPGCQDCGVYEEFDTNHSVLYLETWDSEAEFNRHLQSSLYLRVLNAIELCRKKPDLCFYHTGAAEHMELIQTLRGADSETGQD